MSQQSEYLPMSGGGAINLVASSHPEPPRADPAADRFSRAELLKQQHWTDADLEVASSVGFPGVKYQVMSRGRIDFQWSRREVESWLARIRGLRIR
jgi:hypothetical protein